MLIPVIARRETRVRYVYWGPVDRHGLSPRDDKGGVFYHEESDEFGVLTLSLRGGQYGRRGNPSCFGGRGRVCGTFTDIQWIATPQEARDDKGGAGGYAGRFLRGQWVATGLRPRDDKGD